MWMMFDGLNLFFLKNIKYHLNVKYNLNWNNFNKNKTLV